VDPEACRVGGSEVSVFLSRSRRWIVGIRVSRGLVGSSRRLSYPSFHSVCTRPQPSTYQESSVLFGFNVAICVTVTISDREERSVDDDPLYSSGQVHCRV